MSVSKWQWKRFVFLAKAKPRQMLSHWNWNKAIINKMNVTFSIIRGYVRISVKVLSSYSCFLPRHFARFNNFRDWQMFRGRPVTLIKKVVQRCSVEKLFWEISQNPQENTCVRVSFLIRLQALVLGLQLY